MHHQRLLSLLRKILSCPTAPFHEYHVKRQIVKLLDPLEHVSIEEDEYGNVIATYKRGKSSRKKRPRLAFGAHMDHPGWVRSPENKDEVTFLGGVPQDMLKIHPIEWFGEFGMWKLAPFVTRNGLIHSRVCDDLVGCAAIVAMMMELEEMELETTVYGIFTRAEEVGFVGAVELAKNWPLPSNTVFVSLETSSPRGGATMGRGPVIRAGDRMSLFHDGVTSELIDAAAEAEIEVQRHLLDGGSCEATAMNIYGIPAAGISVILGNYHNCTTERGIAEEYVSISDVKGMIKLITATVRRIAEQKSSSKQAMKKRLEKRVREHRKFAKAATPAWEEFESETL